MIWSGYLEWGSQASVSAIYGKRGIDMKLFLSALLIIFFAIIGFPSQGLTTHYTYLAVLNGPSESPPNASPGTGSARVVYDSTAHTLHVKATFSGLLGTTTAAHIHCPTALPFTGNAGVATQTPTFAGFPLGVFSGTYDHTFDLTLASSWNPSFIATYGGTPAGAEAELSASLAAKTAYFNIHSTLFPGGEIRGFLIVEAPLPGTLFLLFE